MDLEYKESGCTITGIYWGSSDVRFSYREKGPSWISDKGQVIFERNKKKLGVMNRVDGPAHIHFNGSIAYKKDGRYHRTAGPAFISVEGNKQYWIKGSELPQVEFFAIYGVM